jgi:hypothetical protein
MFLSVNEVLSEKGLDVGLHYMTNYSYSADTCLAVSGVVNVIILYFFLCGRNRASLKGSFDSKPYYEGSSYEKTSQVNPVDSLLLLRIIYDAIFSKAATDCIPLLPGAHIPVLPSSGHLKKRSMSNESFHKKSGLPLVTQRVFTPYWCLSLTRTSHIRLSDTRYPCTLSKLVGDSTLDFHISRLKKISSVMPEADDMLVKYQIKYLYQLIWRVIRLSYPLTGFDHMTGGLLTLQECMFLKLLRQQTDKIGDYRI